MSDKNLYSKVYNYRIDNDVPPQQEVSLGWSTGRHNYERQARLDKHAHDDGYDSWEDKVKGGPTSYEPSSVTSVYVLPLQDTEKLLMLLAKLACDELNKNAFLAFYHIFDRGHNMGLDRSRIKEIAISTSRFNQIKLGQLIVGEIFMTLYKNAFHKNNIQPDMNPIPLNTSQFNELEILLARLAFETINAQEMQDLGETKTDFGMDVLQLYYELYFDLKKRAEQIGVSISEVQEGSQRIGISGDTIVPLSDGNQISLYDIEKRILDFIAKTTLNQK